MEEIKETKGTSIRAWFISDTHFCHPSILYFRPKRREAAGITLEELQADKIAATKKHDEWLIEKWNNTINRCDYVYILGDFCLGNREYTERLLQRLNGKKFLVRGNHDKSCKGLERYFEWVGDIKECKFNYNQYKFIDPNETFCVEMCHFPMVAWNRRTHGTCHLQGHVHGALDTINEESKELRVDVGIDAKLSGLEFIPLEKLYKHFTDIRDNAGCSTFKEYANKLMDEQDFRM
jgi:calcineurin-like phosphoesterase family protein